MSEPVWSWSRSLGRLFLPVLIALGLGVLCATSMTAAATGSMGAPAGDASSAVVAMAGMPGMDDGGCDGACASEPGMVCALTAAAAPLTLWGLPLLRGRGGFLGLLPRTSGGVAQGRESRAWPGWSRVSPVSLCVLRV